MRWLRKIPDATSEPRLLPLDAYRADLDAAGRDRVDRRLREQLHTIPLEPGEYLDNEGERWILSSDNSWTDHFGTTRSSLYTPILSSFGPFTSVGQSPQNAAGGADG